MEEAESEKRKAFGTSLRHERNKRGLSQTKLVKQVNERFGRTILTQATMSAWETGRQLPNPEKIDAVKALEEILETPGQLTAALGVSFENTAPINFSYTRMIEILKVIARCKFSPEMIGLVIKLGEEDGAHLIRLALERMEKMQNAGCSITTYEALKALVEL